MEADGGVTLLVSSTEVGQGAHWSSARSSPRSWPCRSIEVRESRRRYPRHPLRPLHRRQPLHHHRRSRRATRRRRHPLATPGHRFASAGSSDRGSKFAPRPFGTRGSRIPYPDLIKAHFGMVGGELIGREVAPSGKRLLWRAGLLGSLHRRRRGRGRSRNGARDGQQSRQRRRRRQSAQPALVEAQEMGGAMQGIGNALRGDAIRRRRDVGERHPLRISRPTIADMPDTFGQHRGERGRPRPIRRQGRRRARWQGWRGNSHRALADAGLKVDERLPRQARGGRWPAARTARRETAPLPAPGRGVG